MGVVHKLKEEVVQFIVEQKRKNPKISCRKLASTASEAFQISISKSAINNILHDANMSSPVGRPAGSFSGYKKYRIPPEAKEKLFSGKKQGAKSKAPVKNKEVAKASVRRDPEPPDAVAPAGKPPNQPSRAKLDEKKQLKIPAPKPAGRAAEPNPSAEVKGGQLCDGLGCIFLKASEWEFSSKPIIGDLLRQFIGNGDLIDFDTIGEILLFMQPFGIKRVADISNYSGQGLWALNGLNKKVEGSSVMNVINGIQNMRQLALRYSVEAAHLFSMINAVKFHLEDGSNVVLDAQMSACWPKGDLPALTAPTNKVMSIISKQILNNIWPVTICCLSGSDKISEESLNLISALSGTKGKNIHEITVHDINNEKMAHFGSVYSKKRLFLAGLWPWQDQFEELGKSSQTANQGRFECPALGHEVHFRVVETFLDELHHYGLNEPLRVIFLKMSASSAPFLGVVTNSAEDELTCRDAVDIYASRWPYLQSGYNAYKVKHQSIGQPGEDAAPALFNTEHSLFSRNVNISNLESYDIYGVTDSLLAVLQEHSQEAFFPQQYSGLDLNTMKSMIYDAEGYLSVSNSQINAKLRLGKDHAQYKDDFEYAVMRVNESSIHDWKGRKLTLYL